MCAGVETLERSLVGVGGRRSEVANGWEGDGGGISHGCCGEQ